MNFRNDFSERESPRIISLTVNSGLVEKSRTESSTLAVMFVFVMLIVLVNIVVIVGLLKGWQNPSETNQRTHQDV